MENRKRKADFSRKDIVSAIEKRYESPLPALQDLSKLSPLDLTQAWIARSASYKDSSLKLVIRRLAPSVVSVSYFTGVHRIVDRTGFIIDWDDSKGIATVLTSAKLMSSPLDRDDYSIIVRLANGKILLAEEDYVDFYHNIATFKVKPDAKLTPLDIYSTPENLEGVEVVALDRDFYTCKLYECCGLFRKDYPYFGCELLASSTCGGNQASEGGPLITKAGQIIGINFYDGDQCVHPLPTSVISLCLRRWKTHGIVMRPWLGVTVIDIRNLPLDTYETMHEFKNLSDSDLVVKEVHKGSPADKFGVRSGVSISVVRVNKKKFKIFGLQEYVQRLDVVSDKLSARGPCQTVTMVYSSVNGDRKVVPAENLCVNDKNFCSSWPDGNDSKWDFTRPLRDSTRIDTESPMPLY